MLYKKAEGFTVLELVIVVVIIGILAAIALPSYFGMKEREHDKDASANLKLIMAAQRIYRMERGGYLENGTIANINDLLRLSLPAAANNIWDFKTEANNAGAPPTTCGQATRTTTSRTISFNNIGEDDPVKDGVCTDY